MFRLFLTVVILGGTLSPVYGQSADADADAASRLRIALAIAAAQQQQNKPAPKPPVPKAAWLDYAKGTAQSFHDGLPLVTFLGTPARKIQGATSCQTDGPLDGYDAPAIIVSKPARGWHDWIATLPPTATDEVIRMTWVPAPRQEVGQQAAPFFQGAGRHAVRDDSPWLPVGEQERVRKLWPDDLAFPANLRFYRLSQRYQKLYTMSSQPYNDIVPLEDTSAMLAHSGGLEGISGWKSTKGLMLPEGKKIRVWQEPTDVRAFALTPRWRWSFPAGTVAYDVLTKGDRIFEIRSMEKDKEGYWYAGVDFKDEQARPAGYAGLTKSCASCHDRPGQIVDVAGQIYRHVTWGDDSRFSWRPFNENGQLDNRWPLE